MSVELLVEEIKQMHAAVLGSELLEVREPEVVLQALEEGASEIPLILQWDDEPHSLVLQELRGDRVVFFNGMQLPVPPPAGTELEDQGPPRLAEEPGLESFSRDEFVRLFSQRGAVCLLSS